MAIKQAIPTDFMGVRFRSKSEAMFANVLENIGQTWFYEPSFLTVGDYTPDFISITKRNNRQIFANIIEYKPSRPTKAYFERLLIKSSDIFQKTGMMSKSFTIVSVNFFEPFNIKCWSIVSGKWVEVHTSGVTEEVFNSVRSYRYDLDHTAAILPEQDWSQLLRNPHENTGLVTLIGRKDEPLRLERLKKVIRYIESNCPKILRSISSLEDNKGELTCSWVPQCRRIGNGKTTVENAWESVGECASNVIHEYQ